MSPARSQPSHQTPGSGRRTLASRCAGTGMQAPHQYRPASQSAEATRRSGGSGVTLALGLAIALGARVGVPVELAVAVAEGEGGAVTAEGDGGVDGWELGELELVAVGDAVSLTEGDGAAVREARGDSVVLRLAVVLVLGVALLLEVVLGQSKAAELALGLELAQADAEAVAEVDGVGKGLALGRPAHAGTSQTNGRTPPQARDDVIPAASVA